MLTKENKDIELDCISIGGKPAATVKTNNCVQLKDAKFVVHEQRNEKNANVFIQFFSFLLFFFECRLLHSFAVL